MFRWTSYFVMVFKPPTVEVFLVMFLKADKFYLSKDFVFVIEIHQIETLARNLLPVKTLINAINKHKNDAVVDWHRPRTFQVNTLVLLPISYKIFEH